MVNAAPVYNDAPPVAALYQLYTGELAAELAVNTVPLPAQTDNVPDTVGAAGKALTVIEVEAEFEQPFASVIV